MNTTLDRATRSVGEFYALAMDSASALRRPFQWREFLEQCWFIARVSLLPTVLMSVPFTVLVVFTLNSLLGEIGASDLSGAGAGLGAVTQIGPLVTVLVVAGAGATAITADLGSRTIREEVDAALLNGAVCAIGLIGGFFFSVYLQNVTAGAYASGITLLVGLPELLLSEVKAALFGMIAGLIACYRGLAVVGGPRSVGEAVNETVVFSFVALFLVNMLLTSVGVALSGN